MEGQMPRLGKFNINSDFPSILKTQGVTGTINFPQTTISAWALASRTINITVQPDAILTPNISVGGVCYPVPYFSQGDDTFLREVILERTSQTNVRAILSIQNNTNSSQTQSAMTVDIYINMFRLP